MTTRPGLTAICSLASVLTALGSWCCGAGYPIVDTGQEHCYNGEHGIAYPAAGQPFSGQDAQYQGLAPSYRDNGDGTVSDLVTGLMWQKDPGGKKTLREATAGAADCRLGGHDDWRLPGIKELYSLILFSGVDPDVRSTQPEFQRPFLDDEIFVFHYGDTARGERIIDAQYVSSTRYVSTTMHADATVFGVNFADGRIKGYPVRRPRGGGEMAFYARYVRGNRDYGENDFRDNGDGTVTDRATGLMWAKVDSGHLRAGPAGDGRLDWQQALAWVDGLKYAGYDDWRLPNVKELQSIVDYTRSPDTTGSAAIDPVFAVTSIKGEDGRRDFPFFWSGTTHANFHNGAAAAYVAFGESPGWMRSPRGEYQLLDVHGAGSQRSDPKSGDPARYPHGRGPQGDVIRILNFVRPVRGGQAAWRSDGPRVETQAAGPKVPSDGARPPGLPGFVERLDRDGDGRVSRKEFDGPAEHFPHLDRNGDGYLSEDEAPPPRPMGKRPPAGPRRPRR